MSTDAKKALVRPFVERQGCEFQISSGEGKIEEPHATQSLPQHYVIDASVRTRFEWTGIDVRHFNESLDWMIEAASGDR